MAFLNSLETVLQSDDLCLNDCNSSKRLHSYAQSNYFDPMDLGISDYEDELDKLRAPELDDQHDPHPLSDLNLLQLVQAS